jgi:NtrC-family two-component system sensor histidine kinase KinB
MSESMSPRVELSASRVNNEVRELEFLHETSQVLTATLDLDGILRSLMDQVVRFFGVEAASVALLEEEGDSVCFRVAVGKAADQVVGMRLAVGQGIAGWVVQAGETAIVPSAHADSRFSSHCDERTGFETTTVMAVPIKHAGKTIGVIEALNPAGGSFDANAERLMRAVADSAAAAIRNAGIYDRARRAELRYQSLFDESSDPIIVTDLQGAILDCNPRAVDMLGCSRGDLVAADGHGPLGISVQEFETSLHRILAGERVKLDLTTQVADGEKQYLETHAARIDYGGRQAIQWVGHDVSERIALVHMREELTHMIIHDLRNPLSSILSGLQLVTTALETGDDTLPVSEILQIASRSGQKLNHLIDSLLDLGQLESGETEFSQGPVDAESLAREALEGFAPLAIKKHQVFRTRIPTVLPPISANRELISRVLVNLLDNAVRYTPEGGSILLAIEAEGQRVVFSVTDSGPGIPSSERDRVFERFVRLGNAKGVPGSGLGLAFCKLAVEAHGGSIWVESDVGRGSTFRFALPLAATQRAEAVGDTEGGAGPAPDRQH